MKVPRKYRRQHRRQLIKKDKKDLKMFFAEYIRRQQLQNTYKDEEEE